MVDNLTHVDIRFFTQNASHNKILKFGTAYAEVLSTKYERTGSYIKSIEVTNCIEYISYYSFCELFW